jgi:hypothetical protein
MSLLLPFHERSKYWQLPTQPRTPPSLHVCGRPSILPHRRLICLPRI